MARYRKKPVVIDAEQFFHDMLPWPEGVQIDHDSPTGYGIFTLEDTKRRHEVTCSDWIVTGTAGEKYPVKADIFHEIYEPVDDGKEVHLYGS